MRQGKALAGKAVTSQTQVTEARSLPPGTSAQKSQPIALTRALELRTGKILNGYADSWCAYAVLEVHAAIWKERGMLTAENKHAKHG